MGANWVFRMEGGGEAVNLCVPAWVNEPVHPFPERHATAGY